MSTGNKVGEFYAQLLQVQEPLRIVVVMGRQAKQQDLLADQVQYPVPERHWVKLLGFVKDMDRLTALADVFVGKPGGLSVAENATLGVPMIMLDPIPGQETENALLLLNEEAGKIVRKLHDLPTRIDDILKMSSAPACQGDSDTGPAVRPKLEKMRRNIAALGRPYAAYDIAKDLLARNVTPLSLRRELATQRGPILPSTDASKC
jgi:processive 1,2-diacylglycerol beta-glucosyltransferase